jgi:Spy/CpxP family protein refolding chaperone
MKKLVLAGLVVTSSLFAYNYDDRDGFHQKPNFEENRGGKFKKPPMEDRDILRVFHRLDLSTQQRDKIRTIIKESRTKDFKRKNILKLSFKDGKFDKNVYINKKTENFNNRVKKQAEIIEKILNVLTEAQKKEFQQIIEKPLNDRNFDGRR